MQPGRGGRGDPFGGGFGDPFGGGFGDPFGGGFGSPFGGGFGSPFGGPRSLISSVFGGRDPFDDPFFTQPFGSTMFGGQSMFRPSMFGPSMSLFGDSPSAGFIEAQQPPQQQQQQRRGPIIEEISSGDEGEEEGRGGGEKEERPRKHSRSGREPIVEHPDDGTEERRVRPMQHRNEFNRETSLNAMQPQNRSFSFQSSRVTYGGTNGAYYTSSTTRKMGDNGVLLEEKKEADTVTGKAEHRISKGIHDKGHTLTRKLNPDGKVDTMQTLHNLNEDELTGFEETWKGNAKKHLPGWNERNDVHANIGSSNNMQASRQGWALPAAEQQGAPNRTESHKAKLPKRRN